MEYVCFFCSRNFQGRNGIGSEIAWLKCLYRHLGISSKLFSKIGAYSKFTLEMASNIKFCECCGKIMEKFSQLYQFLEIIQMEVNHQLKLIQFKLEDMPTQEEAKVGDISQLLRKEKERILVKCKSKPLKGQPFVRISRLNPTKITIKKEQEDTNLSFNDPQLTEEYEIRLVKTDPQREDKDDMSSNFSEANSIGEALEVKSIPESTFYYCGICGKEFDEERNFLRHEKTSHVKKVSRLEQNPYPCPNIGCSWRFKRKAILERHINHKRCKFPNSWKTDEAKFKWTGSDLNEEKKIPFKVTCKICRKEMLNKSLPIHLKTVHSAKPKYICDICGKLFVRSDVLKLHLKICKPNPEQINFKHGCEICLKRFKDKGTLSAHKKFVHVDVRNYKCDICERSFKTGRHLREHKDLHEGKRFPCREEGCGKTFSREYTMFAHMHKEHGYEKPQRHRPATAPEQNFCCSKCGKEFSKRKEWLRHERRKHIRIPGGQPGKNKYLCPNTGCDWRFRTNWHMKRHIKICKFGIASSQHKPSIHLAREVDELNSILGENKTRVKI